MVQNTVDKTLRSEHEWDIIQILHGPMTGEKEHSSTWVGL